MIYTSNGIPEANKFLVAFTSGKAFGSYPMAILICGYEKISLISPSIQTY